MSDVLGQKLCTSLGDRLESVAWTPEETPLGVKRKLCTEDREVVELVSKRAKLCQSAFVLNAFSSAEKMMPAMH